jgi:hypothetical protein
MRPMPSVPPFVRSAYSATSFRIPTESGHSRNILWGCGLTLRGLRWVHYACHPFDDGRAPNLLASEARHHAPYLLIELTQGAPVGSHGKSKGVRDPLSLDAHRVLRQDVDPSSRIVP